MATSKSSSSSTSFLESLRQSPATQHLTEQARGLVEARTGRASGALTDKLSSASKALGDIGESGKLPALGEGAKRMLQGDSPLKSAIGAATSGIADKAKGMLGGKGKGKGGAKKSTNIEESIDIGAPRSTVYNQWTQFTDFSQFMKGVESVEQVSDTETNWRVKVFKSRRSWKAKIQEQVPDHRIVWTSEGEKGSVRGAVTFHPLARDLTRVLVTMEYFPNGLMEKTGNMWRAAGRRTRLDLKNFRRFVMLQGEETGAWRGEVHRGKVVRRRDAGSSCEQGSRGRRRPTDSGRESGRPRQDRESRERGGARSSREGRDSGRGKSDGEAPGAGRSRSVRGSQPARRARSESRSRAEARSRDEGGSRDSDRDSGSGSDGDPEAGRSGRRSGGSRAARQGPAGSAPRKRSARKVSARMAARPNNGPQPATSETQSSARKAAAKKAPAKKAPAKKATKAPAKKATNKAPARKAPAKKSAAKRAPAKRAPARKAAAKKAPAKKAAARSSASKRPPTKVSR
jgi:uncharacterized membrane protein